MKTKKMVVNTNLKMVDYLVMVNEIVLEYFNEEGEYQPQIGTLNAMRLFYNNCVVESKFDISHDIVDAMDMEPIVNDDEFIAAFNDAIIGDCPGICMDFANAYKDALDIVETKKTSIERAVNSVKNMITSILDVINPLLSDEHIDKVSEIARDVSNGKISAEAVIDAYGKSKRFKEVISSGEKDSNVVPIDHLKK